MARGVAAAGGLGEVGAGEGRLSVVLLLALVAFVGGIFFFVWAVARWYLRGSDDFSAFDGPAPGERHFVASEPNAKTKHDGDPEGGHEGVLALLKRSRRELDGVPLHQRLAAGRRLLDELLPVPEGTEVRFVPADAAGVRAEWVFTPEADPDRRTLYIHGGGFVIGSARSHRRLTARFAQMTRGAVLAIDYRLMPEHSRRAGVEDCRTAYRWLLEHGPADRRAAPSKVWVAGDSAGGNLALALLAWIRDQPGLRMPDAAVVFSPQTDSTASSPSLRGNIATDPMLGVIFGRLARLPDALLLWGTWLLKRKHPRDPMISPLFGDLSRLPPVLVQASRAEMLLGDARRYVHRAIAAGSPARLQTWDRMVHVWQIFHPHLREGREALAEVEKFLQDPPRR
jgi:epsilon-lactone hydrolase